MNEDINNPILPRDLLENARQLRKNQTNAEKLLWYILRNRQFRKLKFRRQHPLPPYILDFYYQELNLCIELDGGQHYGQEGITKDMERTRFIEKQGIHVLRFSNLDVLKNTEGVLERIWEICEKIVPSL